MFDRREHLCARAVARRAGAAEGDVIIDPRGRQVDHHHAGAHPFAEIADMPGAVADDAGGQAEIAAVGDSERFLRSEEHTSELQSLMRSSYAVFCLKKKNKEN